MKCFRMMRPTVYVYFVQSIACVFDSVDKHKVTELLSSYLVIQVYVMLTYVTTMQYRYYVFILGEAYSVAKTANSVSIGGGGGGGGHVYSFKKACGSNEIISFGEIKGAKCVGWVGFHKYRVE